MGALPPFTSVCFLLSSGSRGPGLTLGAENHRVQALLGVWVLLGDRRVGSGRTLARGLLRLGQN